MTKIFIFTFYFLIQIFCYSENYEKKILVTTFPIYQIVRNVIIDREGIKIDLMIQSRQGCPHNYALTPKDILKISKADILIINGLGMEDFLEASVLNINSKINIIDSSKGINDLLKYSKIEDHKNDHEYKKNTDMKSDEEMEENEHMQDNNNHLTHKDINPHLFVSPRMTAKIALNIAESLSKLDPNGAFIYIKNANAYSKIMNNLADEMQLLGKSLNNKNVVQPHGAFDYFARDIGLEIKANMLAHGQEPSASEMIRLIKIIKDNKVGAIISEPQYSEKLSKTLSKETGVDIAYLDPSATGPNDAPLNYYETVIRKNMKILEKVLRIR